MQFNLIGLVLIGKKFNMPDDRNEMLNGPRGQIAHLGNDVNPKYFHTQLK